jgi:Uma2 family endonuclease
MTALRESFPPLTPEEYLDWEERQEQKYEYLNGEFSLNPVTITVN